MDKIDYEILSLLAKDARMPVKEIAAAVRLTSPAVSGRIHKLESSGIIKGYTVVLSAPEESKIVDAIISLSCTPDVRGVMLDLINSLPQVQRCYQVTGTFSFLTIVRCGNMTELENIIMSFQKLGQTNTQIVLSTPVDHTGINRIIDSSL